MKRAFKLFLSLLVTVAFSWWAFHDTNWKEQWASLRSANYLWLLPYFATLLTIHVLRTLRWGCLLSGMEKVPFRALNEASGIGFMMLIVLPFRLGEFARPYLIAQRSGIRKSAAMTSVVLERITDGILIAVLLRVLLFFIPDTAPQVGLVRFAGNAMFGIFTGGLAFLLFSLWQQARAVALVRATLGRLSPKAAERAAGIVDTFVGAMRQLPSRGQLALFFLYTAGYWVLNGWG
ncbi:MAG TPA: lysylphosphatidylglycerol synthase transmembrane domain-containing protein, partial [Myxococcaceae bacterium]|nr:lysylphosphatidylglycerol synthase transmembrane domain-containing protein [Myxococcaceae bacterium]